MALVNGIDKEKIKEIRKEKAIKQQEELKKLKAKKDGNAKEEHEHKEDVISVYNNLSEEERQAIKDANENG